MTQAKHTPQDKIQEIMSLIDDWSENDFIAAEAMVDPWSEHAPSAPMQMLEKLDKEANDARALIESKLRELVREPLSDEVITMIDDSTHFHESTDWSIRFARNIERAHGITNTSGVA